MLVAQELEYGVQPLPAGVSVFKGKLPDEIVNNLLKYVDTVNTNSADSTLVANISGDQSHLDIKHPLMAEYAATLLENCCLYHDLTAVHCTTRNINSSSLHRAIGFHSCWSVKMNPNDYNPVHLHQTTSFSGLSAITYLKVPEHIIEDARATFKQDNEHYYKPNGLLQFIWTGQNASLNDDYSPSTSTFVVPIVGEYYIFPKWLQHTVYPYEGEGQRWSVQANFNVFTDEELILRGEGTNGSAR